jgi:glycosyltransferase involved in cell wall biosynthesis
MRVAFISNMWHVSRSVGYNRYAISLLRALQRTAEADWELCGEHERGLHPAMRDGLAGTAHCLPLGRGTLATQYACRRLDRRVRPALWHVLTDEPAPLLARGPVVVTCHGLPRWLRFRHLLADRKVPGGYWDYQEFPDSWGFRRLAFRQRWLWKAYLWKADAVIAVSDYVRWELTEKFGVPARKITVVHEAADPLFHQPRPAGEVESARHRYGLPPRYVLAVASFARTKNTEGLLALAVELKKAAEARLVLVGPAGVRDRYVRLARQLGLEPGEDVWLLEDILDTDLACLYRGAEVFVNLAWEESFGLPIAEAMASGTPVVASCLTAVPEIVGDGGLLVDPADRQAVADLVLRILADTALREDLRARARRRGQAFSWAAAAAQTWNVYRSLGAKG